MDDVRLEAIQNVLDRIGSYQDGAPEGTVERELRSALDQAGVEASAQEVAALTRAVEANPAGVHAADVLT